MAFNRKDGDNNFVTVGRRHIAFWEADGSCNKGLYGRNKRTSFSCATYDKNGKCYAGGANGRIYEYAGGRSCTRTHSAHKKFICGLKCVNDNEMLSGGYDGKLKLWNTDDMTVTKEWQFDCLIRAVDMDANGKIVVGLRDGHIKHLHRDNDECGVLMQSHSDGEVWGLAVTP